MACDGYCRGCIYLARGLYLSCDFFSVTGQVRGCPAGTGCTRKKTGKRARSVDAEAFRLPPAPRRAMTEDERKAAQTEYMRRYVDKLRAELGGRQGSAVRAFLAERQLTHAGLARMLGVSDTAVRDWAQERKRARWDLLATVGCMKPEGL